MKAALLPFSFFLLPFFAAESATVSLARLVKESPAGVVRVPAGVYRLEAPLVIGPECSGRRFVADGEVIVDGGRVITGWKRLEGDVWTADVPWVKRFEKSFRSLFVNGEARPLACSVKHPKPGTFHVARGGGDNIFNDGGLFKTDWQDVENGEITFYHFWVDTHLRLKRIEPDKVYFHRPARRALGTGNTNNEEGSNNAWFIVENLRELMTVPGEWCVDELHGKVYYLAKPGENPATAEIVAPYTDELVVFRSDINGGAKPVKDVVFEGFVFRHSNYTLGIDEFNDFQASQGVRRR